MPERLLVIVIVLAIVLAVWALVRRRSTSHQGRNAEDLLQTGHPLVLAFSTPECVPCRTAQKPALDQLQRRYAGQVDVRVIDATIEPEIASRFGILTVPSTVVVGANGKVLAVNYGLARADKLAKQLSLNGQYGRR